MKIEHVLSAHNVITATLKGIGGSGVDVTPPAPITELTAATYPGYIYLTWAEPSDSDYARVLIQRKEGSVPESIDDGETVYVGKSFFRDTNVKSGQEYFYRAFSGDATGNYNADASQVASATGYYDDTPPLAPYNVRLTINDFNEYVVTGYTEAGATVSAEKGTYSWNNIADNTGYFIIVIPASDVAIGDEILLYAKDTSGNVSTDNQTFIVTSGRDTMPPEFYGEVLMSGNEVTGYYVVGSTEAGATVFVTNFVSSWRIYADEKGHFMIYVQPELVQIGEELTVFAIDDVGNQSESIKVIVPENADFEPPTFGGIINISGDSPNGYLISGVVNEENYTIKIYRGTELLTSKQYTNNIEGFEVTMGPGALIENEVLRVTASDIHGNENNGVEVTVPEDPVVYAPAVMDIFALGKEGFVRLIWTVPPFSEPVYVTIVRNATGYPKNINDGDVIYSQIGAGILTYDDHGVDTAGGVQYYYRFFTNTLNGPVTDSETQITTAVTVYDGTPPEKPIITSISGIVSTGYRIYGTAEPYANVSCTWYPVITDPYYVSAVADRNGAFVLDCRDSFIKVGDAVEIWVQDRTGNTSETVFVSIPSDAAFIAGDFIPPPMQILSTITAEHKKFTLSIEENGDSTSNFVVTVSTVEIRHPYDTNATVVYDGRFKPVVTWEDALIEEGKQYYFYLFPYDSYKNYAFPLEPFATGIGRFDVEADRTPPEIVTITNSVSYHNTMEITFTVPSDEDFAGIYIVRKTSLMPENIADGVMVDLKKASIPGASYTFHDSHEFVHGEAYYYRFFPYDESMNINDDDSQYALLTGHSDTVPPNKPQNVTIYGDPASGYTVSGEAEAGMVAYADVGGSLFPGTVGQDGVFIIQIGAGLATPGQSISVFIFKTEGVVSESVLISIPQDFSSIFGFTIDESNSDPETSVQYIHGAEGMEPGSENWDSVFPFNRIRPVLLDKKTGAVVGELNKNNFGQDIHGGSITLTEDVDVMIEFPKLYWKIEKENDVISVQVSEEQSGAGFKALAHTDGNGAVKDKLYVSAYQATRFGTFGNYHMSSHFGTLFQTSASKSAIDGYVTSNDTTGRYRTMNWSQWTMLQILFVLRYKTMNSLTALGKGPASGARSTGALKESGMYTVSTSPAPNNKFSGIENLFTTSLPHWISDLTTNESVDFVINGTTVKTEFTGYISGFITKTAGTTELGFLPLTIGGTSTTHYESLLYINAGKDVVVCSSSNFNPAFSLNANTSTSTYAGVFITYL
ncbi:Ig-like domain-containing protein [Lederbergia citrisecunda]|uniref:Ig-like domain-containing protein n=1 Tax=Lederbergia citrisecunda TaxID=2833583 RepID=UPI003D2DD004